MKRYQLLGLVLSAVLVVTAPSKAVILYGTDDPSANTAAPTGELAGSGWQYEGLFAGFLGTVIASNYFVTANHIGGSVGEGFYFNGILYTTTAVFRDPASDLAVWQIAGTFPNQAQLYSGPAGSEVNLHLVVFGRGTQRGGPVLVGTDSHLGGWAWGVYDYVQRWGTNVVGSIVSDPAYGKLLRAPFDANAGPNEAHLSSGDSGGGVFVLNASTNRWEFAGVNLAVDGPFSISMDGSNPFNAAMFDTSGLFVQSDQGNWMTAPNPSAFYATEIAARRGFIESVVMRLVSVVSRKTHGRAGIFDINLPQTPIPGIECRSGDYAIVFTFASNVSIQGARVTSGAGRVKNYRVTGNQVLVNLTRVGNAQTVVLTLAGVNDGINTSDVQATMSVLVGDVTADGIVNSTDVSEVQSQLHQPVTASNFRDDVKPDGVINNHDVNMVR
jgi:Dockerin type I domain